MAEANVWIIDIETSPLIVLVWSLGQQFVSKEQLIKDWHIMSFSAKKLNAPTHTLEHMETRTGNDKPLLKRLWEIFNEADIIITQNGKKFDEPKIKARMMLNGFKPYKPFQHYDTYEQNTDKEFTSHSLDYLTEKFCVKFKKLSHKMFSGLSLWKECLGIKIIYRPNPLAWAEMKKYNDNDVLSDEELYLNTREWAKKSAPSPFAPPVSTPKCPYCKSFQARSLGLRKTKTNKYRRYLCKNCGKTFKGDKFL